MGRVFADSNVLFPFSVMDVLLALSEDGVHEVIWTDDLLDEWERVIVREHKRSPESAAQVTTAVREFFKDSKVERDEYEDLIAEMPGKDADDHAHMAAAVARQPCTILTNNAKDFPSAVLAKRGVRVTDADTYLCELVGEISEEVIDTVARLAAEKTRPPKTPLDLVDDLEHAGVPRFAEAVRCCSSRADRAAHQSWIGELPEVVTAPPAPRFPLAGDGQHEACLRGVDRCRGSLQHGGFSHASRPVDLEGLEVEPADLVRSLEWGSAMAGDAAAGCVTAEEHRWSAVQCIVVTVVRGRRVCEPSTVGRSSDERYVGNM